MRPLQSRVFITVCGVAIVFLLVFTAQATSSHPENSYKAVVDRVVDGDTVDLNILLWPDLQYKQRIRVYGVDTPEVRTRTLCEKKDGLKASALVKGLLPVNAVVTLQVVGVGKYGRPLGNIATVDGVDIGSLLITEGLAYPYFGDKKKEWECLES